MTMLTPMPLVVLASDAATTSLSSTNAFALMIVGMLVVFTSLSVIGLLIALINRLLDSSEAAKPVVEAAPASAKTDTELVAMLTAAATAALRRPVRVHRVRMLGLTSRQHWVAEGRAGVMTSHRVRRPE
jgi:Na+-transporting methylmalonyl-CoA/oxaloacetate decarboxylase gamma subunit